MKRVKDEAPVVKARMVRMPEIEHPTGFSRASIYRLSKLGMLPPIRKIGLRASGMLEHELDAAIAARAAGAPSVPA
jgi:predicted DNA-binding transcriptional regulator AlpA